MILCEGDAPEGHPGWCCVHLYARILSSSLTSISIFSVCCYSIVSISMVYTTGWPLAMPPGPSKRSQQYDPKTGGNIYWPKYKGPRHVLGIFKPFLGQICTLYSLFKAILLPLNLNGQCEFFCLFWRILLLPQPPGISAFYMSCLGQSGAYVLPNPAYISLQLSSALSVQALIFSWGNSCVVYGTY